MATQNPFGLQAANGLSLAAAKPLSPNNLSQSYTNSAIPSDNDDDNKSKEKDQDHIKVICRFRPKNNKERAEEKRQNLSDKQAISVYNDDTSLEVPRKNKNKPKMNFTVDSVIWYDQSQEQCFNKLAKSTVDSVVEGYNCTIFAFGQTGSGKTYTMFGPDNYARVEELGIIPRSVNYMFDLLDSAKNIMKYQISLSICEVYKEMLRDLLIGKDQKKNRKRLEILSAGKDVRVKNLTELPCKSVGDILKFIVLAQSNRAKHTTDFIGHDSSRSHCVVMISVTQRLLDDTMKFSKLNFGDLAGSELAAKTGTKGTSLKEAGKIHQGLLALENVINALVEKKKHVPYNDSKLTRLLSTSIGGNSKTTLLVTCSPSIWNRDETISTLRFAKRAKKIKNKAKINKRKTREQLEARIIFLENENLALKKKLNKKQFGNNHAKSLKQNKSMNLVVDGDANEQIFGMTLEEKQKNDELLQNKDDEISEHLDEIIKLKNELNEKDDAVKKLEDELATKSEIFYEYDKEKKIYEEEISELNNKLQSQSRQIEKLQDKLQSNIEMETKFKSHSSALSDIVNNSMKDSNSSMISALTEISKQQTDFFNFLKTISNSMEKIHEKQIATETEMNGRFDDVNATILSMGNIYSTTSPKRGAKQQQQQQRREPSLSFNPGDDHEIELSTSEYGDMPFMDDNMSQISDYDIGHHHDRDLSVNSLVLSPEQLALDQLDMDQKKHHRNDNNSKSYLNKDDKDVMNELISSMKSYLIKANELQSATLQQQNQQKLSSTAQSNKDEFKINEHDAKQYKNNFSVGKKVDVLDVSYTWYTATIIDIDVFDKKAVYIKYDNFEERWNEWIPLSKSHRISPHLSRTNMAQIMPSLQSDRGGVHCLVATKFGSSNIAQELQDAFASDSKQTLSIKSILMQGHLYKQSSWNKKSWKRRWFVIRNNLNIYYYDHKNMKSKQYRGVISLGEIAVVQIPKDKGYTKFSFDIRTHKNKTHCFSCGTEGDLVDWMSVLECLIWGEVKQIAVSKVKPQTQRSYAAQKDVKKQKKEEERVVAHRGSFSAFMDKFKTKDKHQGPYTATVMEIE